MPAVSVITPTYDHAPFLGQCIESVLGQTFPSWEQIIVDDGSRDGTGDVARRYGDPRIRYVRQDNVGLARLPAPHPRAGLPARLCAGRGDEHAAGAGGARHAGLRGADVHVPVLRRPAS